MLNSTVNDIIKWVIRGVIFLITSLVFYAVYKKYITTYSLPKYAPNKEFVADNGEREVAEVLFFYTNWCPHCKTAKPEWQALQSEVNGTIKGKIIVFKSVDCDKDTALADKFKVEGYPTIKLVYDNKIYDYDAKPNKDTLLQFLNSVL